MLALEVSEEELVKRLLKRGQTSGRIDDNNDAVIRERIIEYNKKTSPVAEHYKKLNKVIMINGEGSVDEIFSDLCREIDKRIMQV